MTRKSAFSRWLVAALALVVIAVLTGGGWFYRNQEKQLRQSAEDELQTITKLKVDQIAAWRVKQVADTAVLIENSFFIEGVARWVTSPTAENTQAILKLFRSLQIHYHYSDVSLTDVSGQVRLSLSDPPGRLGAEGVRALEQALRERQMVLTDLHLNVDNLNPHLSVIAPLFAPFDESAKPLGAIILQGDARQFLYPLIQSWPTPSRSAETLLVRRDGEDVLYLNLIVIGLLVTTAATAVGWIWQRNSKAYYQSLARAAETLQASDCLLYTSRCV